MSHHDIDNLGNLVVVQSDFNIWSGQTRLVTKDIHLGVGGELPPNDLAQLGCKKICPPSELKCFSRLKTHTRRYLLSIGLKFMNGFAVPVALIDDVTK